jgi:hypothetical protein
MTDAYMTALEAANRLRSITQLPNKPHVPATS